ncbi:MAG: DUF1553 domain-containing protein [Prosthecobacter sp.]|jgi:hypothetical protein|uniref:DUF1553 domain-containing protein n=1 Tax=Prosthecobacter sp. TaxID=1965333 RepID=UPI0019DE75D3|nr:DUF1553 domain-containing protein [Prosthecobacter sp.]MBE2283232.1 DUF1553 domain-containing protein [Prosthecobacter sp.]
MSPFRTSPSWLIWLRNAVILGSLAVGVAWGVGELLTPPVVQAAQGLGLSKQRLADVRKAASGVDSEFAKDWAQKHWPPAERADDLTIARRLSLALTGSIPSLQEVRVLESVKSDDVPQWWLSHLLKDRRTSDYLAERLVRVYVGIETGQLLFYRRRRLVEWLSDAIRENRPYDGIARALIDCSGVWTTNPAVNFVSVTRNMGKSLDEAKLAARVSRAFLGVQMDCVQCHDGKLGSTWKQENFHQLAAYFGQAKFELNGLRDDPKLKYKTRYLGRTEEEVVPARVPWKPELLPEKGTPRDRFAHWVTAKDNRPFARTLVNRVWALLFNRPLISPVDDIPLEGPFPPGMEALADDLIAHDFDLHRLIRVIVATRVFQQSSRSADPAHPTTEEAEKCWAVFPVTRLRPEQMAGSVIQAASLSTIDAETHVLFRIKRDIDVANFVKRYGDSGEDTFEDAGGTIPQRLLLMNGNMVTDNTRGNPLVNAGTRIGMLAPDNSIAVEAAYLSIFTRRPTAAESDHFTRLLAEAKSTNARSNAMADLYWTLMNATEFSWNH